MTKTARLGGKVRALRRRDGMTQARLAELLEISASYLNLIEHNRRPLPATLLLKLARIFDVDLEAFTPDDEVRLQSALMEALGDPFFDPFDLTNNDVRDLVSELPAMGRAVVALYDAWKLSGEQTKVLAERAELTAKDPSSGQPGSASEVVSDFLQRHRNHFAALEDAAEALWTQGSLDRHHLQAGLLEHLREQLGVRVTFVEAGSLDRAVRTYDPESRVLAISEVLPPRTRHFQLAHMIALLSHRELLDELTEDPWLATPEARRLARVVLANYFAGAVLMPYGAFLEAAKSTRYDIELLGHRFRVSFEQVCHRLTTLQRPGHSGIPFHLVRIDLAGNVSKRFSASSMRFPRYSGLCPKWNLFQAFLTPGRLRTQVSQISESSSYFSIARTLHKGEAGYHAPHVVHALELGCELEHAAELVYADGTQLGASELAVPTGITCRLCRRGDCDQRVTPSIYEPLEVDELTRGSSFYVRTR